MIVELQEWQIFLPSRNWIGAFLEQQLRLPVVVVVLVQCEFVLWQRLSLLLLQKPSCWLLLLETMKIKGGIIRGKIWCQGLRISPCPRFWEFWVFWVSVASIYIRRVLVDILKLVAMRKRLWRDKAISSNFFLKFS